MTQRRRSWDRHGTDGLTFAAPGLGTARLGYLYRAISDDAADAAFGAAWDAGVRYFDTAPLYGLGLAATRLSRSRRGEPRDKYVLSTKIARLLKAATEETLDEHGKWFDVPARNEVFDCGYDATVRSVEFALERLGVDRINILFAHDLDVFNHRNRDVLCAKLNDLMESGHKALLRLLDEGTISAFGACMDEFQPCRWLAERGDFDIVLLAGRYTLLERQALDGFLPLCVAQIEAACARHDVCLTDADYQFPLRHRAVVSVFPAEQGLEEMHSSIRADEANIPDALWSDLKADGLLRGDLQT